MISILMYFNISVYSLDDVEIKSLNAKQKVPLLITYALYYLAIITLRAFSVLISVL